MGVIRLDFEMSGRHGLVECFERVTACQGVAVPCDRAGGGVEAAECRAGGVESRVVGVDERFGSFKTPIFLLVYKIRMSMSCTVSILVMYAGRV